MWIERSFYRYCQPMRLDEDRPFIIGSCVAVLSVSALLWFLCS